MYSLRKFQYSFKLFYDLRNYLKDYWKFLWIRFYSIWNSSSRNSRTLFLYTKCNFKFCMIFYCRYQYIYCLLTIIWFLEICEKSTMKFFEFFYIFMYSVKRRIRYFRVGLSLIVKSWDIMKIKIEVLFGLVPDKELFENFSEAIVLSCSGVLNFGPECLVLIWYFYTWKKYW